MKKIVFLIFLIGCFATAQEEDKDKGKALRASNNITWEANKELAENNFVEAEADYRRAISKSNDNIAAPYNLGNAYYNEETYSEAYTRFKQAGEQASEKADKHRAYHNMGNVFMKNKEYQKAVEGYKEALRNDPTDEETRYNLALAKEMLKKEQDEQKNDQDNKDQEDKEDKKDKDQKNEGDNKEDKKGDQDKEENEDKGDEGDKGDEKKEENKEGEGDEKEEQKKQPDKGDQQKEQKQPRPNQLSPQQVQNLLEAMQNEEKKVQEKIDAKKVKGIKTKNEKDW
ncbi:tetratricopeptide repeat protein [Spongiimicrobium sp. 3-5]|uniref:tetratricopeptide repeat protein n=1 Tax=Spongiimicrobium sp. 3-5 TaxID=3332596 RepID=UPI0039814CCC